MARRERAAQRLVLAECLGLPRRCRFHPSMTTHGAWSRTSSDPCVGTDEPSFTFTDGVVNMEYLAAARIGHERTVAVRPIPLTAGMTFSPNS